MRELVTVRPCIVRYRVVGDKVIVLRVRHTAQQPTAPELTPRPRARISAAPDGRTAAAGG